MELTLDQALQKGIEAHKVGQVQEADHLVELFVLGINSGFLLKILVSLWQTIMQAYVNWIFRLDTISDRNSIRDQNSFYCTA